jgi:hypothetical protein
LRLTVFTSGEQHSQQVWTFVAKSQNKPDTFKAKSAWGYPTCSKTSNFEQIRPVLLIFREP